MDHLTSSLTIDFAQRSEAGQKAENQDTLGARLPDDSLLTSKGIAMAVADGVSSSEAAREASQTAITGFLTDYYATPDTWGTRRSAQQVIQALNRALWGRSQNHVHGEGFLTTFSALILKGDTGFIFHIGDTRVYLWRVDEQGKGSLEQLTRDHCQRLNGGAETYLSRALGADMSVDIDMHSIELRAGDLFILTSDGIHDHMTARGLQELVERHQQQPQTLADSALAKALANDSRDNLSIQVARIESLGHASQDDAMRVLSQLPFPPPLDEGKVIDGLRVEKCLHESNRSQVYVVRDEHDGKSMIMKTPSVLFNDDPAYIERFVMEAWIGARIQSPQVARVIHPPQPRSCLYYLTEYVPGPTLGQTLKERGQLSIADSLELLGQLLSGIRAFHRKETLHQDIKPDNIVLSAKGPVIVDFGSCWVANLEEAGAPFVRDRILGTLDFSAPEYRYGGNIGPRSDQFSLAALLYNMLTGKLPYGKHYSKAMDWPAFRKLKYIPASRHNPMVPYWLDKALEKALSLNPAHRYDALSEWWQDLQRPNPRWQHPEQKPLIERRPEQVWQVLALVGWCLVGVLAVMLLR